MHAQPRLYDLLESLFTDLPLLTSRLKSLVAEIKIFLQVFDAFHGLVHQLDADMFRKVVFTSRIVDVCFRYLHAASDDPDSVVHALLPLKGHRAL